MSRLFAAAALAGLFAAVSGCGGSGPKMSEITGTVKYDGKEIAEGDIMFYPEDKNVGPEGGKIKDGKYTMKVKEGKNSVRILATRAVPGKKGPMGEDFVEQYIPEKYNDKTTLTAEVTSGKKQYDFDIPK